MAVMSSSVVVVESVEVFAVLLGIGEVESRGSGEEEGVEGIFALSTDTRREVFVPHQSYLG